MFYSRRQGYFVVVVAACTIACFIILSMHLTDPHIRFNIRTHFIGFQEEGDLKDNLVNIPDPWDSIPSLELFLRMYHKRHHVYDIIFKKSFLLFWPQHIPLVVILDKESEKDHQLEKIIRDNPPYPKVYFEEPRPHIYNNWGYMRMQWSMFYPENYTKAEYVGYVDTDTVFVTVVTPEDLFRDGKPIIIGVFGQFLTGFWEKVAKRNAKIFKRVEVVKCMAYFPVIFKVKHIIECRHYLEKLHNKTFDSIFREKSTDGFFSQFSVMCQCMYIIHRDEYIWRIQQRPNGHFKRNVPGRVPFKFYKKNFTANERSPIARTSMHWKFQRVPHNELLKHPYSVGTYYPQALMMGLCYSGGFDMCPTQCRFFNRSSIHRDLFNFEFTDWTWHAGCIVAQRKHYTDVARVLAFYKSQGRPIFGKKNATFACQRIFKLLKLDAKYQKMKLL